MADGRYGVVQLDSVTPARPRELVEVSEDVGKRIREIRKEEAFQAMLDKWKEEIPVTIHEENLDQVGFLGGTDDGGDARKHRAA